MKTSPGIRCRKVGLIPRQGLWDYDGSCVPGTSSWNQTFSVGVFQWWPKSSGRGFKRLPVVKRFSGPSHDPQSVYAKADAYCHQMEFPNSKCWLGQERRKAERRKEEATQ